MTTRLNVCPMNGLLPVLATAVVYTAPALDLAGPRCLCLNRHVTLRLGFLARVVDDDDSRDGTATRLLHDHLHFVHVSLSW